MHKAQTWLGGCRKYPSAWFKIQCSSLLLWHAKQCHQCYKTPLPVTCSVVWIMLSDHFNRWLVHHFSWVCRTRDEAGSWGGVLENNTKCSISFLQLREIADKLLHSRPGRYTLCSLLNAKCNFIPSPSIFTVSVEIPLQWLENQKFNHTRQIIYYPHSVLHTLLTRSRKRKWKIDLIFI